MTSRPALVLVALLMILAAAPVAASDERNTPEGLEEGYGLPSFNESQGCGEPATSNPLPSQPVRVASGFEVAGSAIPS